MAQSVVFLTGAGISAESGIQTFRSAQGLWENHRVEEVATPQAFTSDPTLVHRFYNERRQHLLSDDVQANAAHDALARLECEFDGLVTIVTQNIDDLHERAGSQRLIHMHGELLKCRCNSCGEVAYCEEKLAVDSVCSKCNNAGVLRPHIVWFGEEPLGMDEIAQSITTCDLFVSVGTSGNVYPAAGFASMASAAGAATLELNLEASNTPGSFDECRFGAATDLVPRLVEELLSLELSIKQFFLK